MKKLAILTALQLLFLLGFGQVQQGFKYQAEVRNAEGIPLVDQPLNLRITLESTTGGNTYYTEVHELTTNKFGLISIVIGEGSVTYGALFEVPWEEGDVTLHAEIKLDGAPNFSTLGQSVFTLCRTHCMPHRVSKVLRALWVLKVSKVCLVRQVPLVLQELGLIIRERGFLGQHMSLAITFSPHHLPIPLLIPCG